MKLMVASDIHGSSFCCEKLIEAVKKEKPDKLLLLGDLLYHGPRNDLPQGYAPKPRCGPCSPLPAWPGGPCQLPESGCHLLQRDLHI